MSMSKRRLISTAIVLTIAVGAMVWALISGRHLSRSSDAASESAKVDEHSVFLDESDDDDLIRVSSIDEVVQLARQSLANMSTSCDDYTARFVKQELDKSGKLSEFSEIQLKVQTRMRNATDDAPKRVYLYFVQPDSVKGREVIWCEDMHDGMMLVHETGLLGLMTLRLDPEGILAMQGQRYPISHIGITPLVEKLIERGEALRDNPEVTVTIKRHHSFDHVSAELIQIRRHTPGNSDDDFSLAEIIYDPQRILILSYRSFGWPEKAGSPLPLLESYAYHDLTMNVGLTDTDFDPANPKYSFP